MCYKKFRFSDFSLMVISSKCRCMRTHLIFFKPPTGTGILYKKYEVGYNSTVEQQQLDFDCALFSHESSDDPKEENDGMLV